MSEVANIVVQEIDDTVVVIIGSVVNTVGGGVTKPQLAALNTAFTDEANVFTQNQIISWLSGANTATLLGDRGEFIIKTKTATEEVDFTISTTDEWIVLRDKLGNKEYDLGNASEKFKELFLSSYANVLGVKSVENDATKVFATNGSVVDVGEVNTIDSITSGEPTGSNQVVNLVSLTQAEYDAGTPIATTFYVITDA